MQLQDVQEGLFYDSENGGYFYASEEASDLVARQKDFYDSSIPNSNAVSCLNLLRLYYLTFKKSYKQKAEELIKVAGKAIKESPAGTAQFLVAIDFYQDSTKEIAVIFDNIVAKNSDIIGLLYEVYLPNRVIAGASEKQSYKLPILKEKTLSGKKMNVFICEDGLCKFPTDNIRKIRQLLDERKFYKLNKP